MFVFTYLEESTTMKDCDIICLALFRWDSEISSTAQSLAAEFSKNNRVFFIEHPYSYKDYWQLKKTAAIKARSKALLKRRHIYRQPLPGYPNLTAVVPGLTLPINFLPNGRIYNWLGRINDRIVQQTVSSIISDFKVGKFIYINFFDPFFIRKMESKNKPGRSVYFSLDDLSQVDYSNRHGTELEREIVQNADYTFCTSKELQRNLAPYSDNVFYLPNAADTSLFNKAAYEPMETPEELKNLNGKKIIGYTGNLEYRTDFELLKKVAEFHQDKILFLIGPVNTNEHREAGLDKLPNVIFAGPRKITELPQYLRRFDCTLIPFKKTILTKSIYPLKINEYLAAGKAVVATDFSEDIKSFGDVAYITANHDDFLAGIQKAIDETDPGMVTRRIARASENTWAARVERFWEIVELRSVKSECEK
jgi:teichuronic acid biosynthesis glycosyltransferase TuaH